jgi:hypothetical protein
MQIVAKEKFESNDRRMPHGSLQRESVLTRLYTAKGERTWEISVDGSDGGGDQGAQVVDVLYNIVDGLLGLHGSPAFRHSRLHGRMDAQPIVNQPPCT